MKAISLPPFSRNPVRSLAWAALAAASAVAAPALAQQLPPVTPATQAAEDQGLTWHGITLYGIIDVGLQYETHGAPFSDYHPAGSANIVQKNSRQSVFGATPSNLSQSRVGIQALEPLAMGDWAFVGRIETFFNPQSGNISDAQKSMALNNGKGAAEQSTNLNSSVAGQAFQTSYAGIASKTYGTLTFGRQLTLLGDGINKYDPNYGSQAFSLIGMSGTYAGGGDTEDKRLDSSLKYNGVYGDLVHLGLLYKFNGSNGAANTDFQAQLGAEFAGLSVDGYYAKAKSAISLAPLSAAQVADLPAGYSLTNTLAGTISDNTSYSLMALYKLNDVFKFFVGYENIEYRNPSQPLEVGFVDIGGYVLGTANNTAYTKPKIVNLYWGGVRYTPIKHLDLTAAYYGYHQNSYAATGANVGCTTNQAGTCSGNFDSFSFDADYSITRRFDVYAGAMYSGVKNGVSNGYIKTTNINPTIGVRFKF
jgi:predicted porin